MKLVFSKEEVAFALGTSVSHFDEIRAVLEAEGFPKPLPVLGDRWSIMEVITWVRGERTPLAQPEH